MPRRAPRTPAAPRARKALRLVAGPSLQLAIGLLAAFLAGAGAGYLAARAACGGPPGLHDASGDSGYQRGWLDGYDDGCAQTRGPAHTSPDHALTFDEARKACSPVPAGRAMAVARGCQPSGQYQADVYDCNDMAAEFWAACREAGVPSFMVVGNTGMDHEGFADCDHCWLVVFCLDEATGAEVALAVDPGAGLIGAIESSGPAASPAGPPPGPGPGAPATPAGVPATVSAQYAEGFFYDSPATLRADLGTRW